MMILQKKKSFLYILSDALSTFVFSTFLPLFYSQFSHNDTFFTISEYFCGQFGMFFLTLAHIFFSEKMRYWGAPRGLFLV
jgi:hypothetical protein